MEMQPHYMNGSVQGISTVFYINGDDKFPGKKVLFNLKRNRNFTSCLDHLTDSLKPPFGAVRNIFTPEGGHKVERFQEINPEGKYVAAGRTGFRRFRYTEISKTPRKSPRRNLMEIPKKNKRFDSIPGKIPTCNIHAKKIYVWPNKEIIARPDCITLKPYQLDDMERVMEALGERLNIKCGGCVDKLYDREGNFIENPSQLVQDNYYVAVRHHDRFYPAIYKDTPMPNITTSRNIAKWGEKLPPIPSRGSKNSKGWSPDQSGYSSYSNSEHSYSQRHKKTTNRRSRGQGENEEPFPRKPVSHKRSSEKKNHREVNYDQDNGRVFKARQSNPHTQGAREIHDDRHTNVDLPIDQVEAEEVKEEDVHPSHERNDKSTPVPSDVDVAKLPPEQNTEETKDEDEEERIRGKPNSKRGSNQTPPKNKSKSPSLNGYDGRNDSPPRQHSSHNHYEDDVRNHSQQGRDDRWDDRNDGYPQDDGRYQNESPRRDSPLQGRDDRYEDRNNLDDRQQEKEKESSFHDHQDQDQYQDPQGEKNDDDNRGFDFDEFEQKKREEAQIMISKSYRGHRARQEYAAKKAAKSAEETVQEAEDNILEKGDQEAEDAAIRIQAGYRGFKDRQRVQALRNQFD